MSIIWDFRVGEDEPEEAGDAGVIFKSSCGIEARLAQCPYVGRIVSGECACLWHPTDAVSR